jgi:hypothetical protein
VPSSLWFKDGVGFGLMMTHRTKPFTFGVVLPRSATRSSGPGRVAGEAEETGFPLTAQESARIRVPEPATWLSVNSVEVPAFE